MRWTHTATFHIAAAPDRVWRALTDPSELHAWFAEHADVAPRLHGRYTFHGRHTLGTPRADQAHGEITHFEPPRRLAFTWNVLGVASLVELKLTDMHTSSSHVAHAASGDAQKGTNPADSTRVAHTSIALTHSFDAELDVERARELIDDHWRLAFGNLSAFVRQGADLIVPPHADASPLIRLELAIEAPPRDVWSALIEPARLDRWIATRASVEPRVGGAYTFGWSYKVGERDVSGGPRRIVELEPARRLTYDWPDWRGDTRVPDQRVTWTLHEVPGGTRVEFEHAGFTRAADWSDYVQGWWHFALALRREVERPTQGFALDEALALLERTPRMLRAWLAGLPSAWLRADEGPSTFSAIEIVAHLVHGEHTDWIPRTRRILEHGVALPFERYDRFAQRRLHAGETLEQLLASFERLRAESLASLRELVDSPARLDARGMHAVLGEVTLRQLLATWVAHDLSHTRQIARVMAQRYRDEVGPWTQFLPVFGEGPLAPRAH